MLDRGQGFFGFASSYQDPELKVYEDPYNLKPGWPALEEDFTIDLDLNSELHTDGKHYAYQPFRMLAMMLGCAGDEVFNPTFDWEALNRANNHWEIGRLLTTNDPNRGIRNDYNAYVKNSSNLATTSNIKALRIMVSPISYYAHKLWEYYYAPSGGSTRAKKLSKIPHLLESISTNKVTLDAEGKLNFTESIFNNFEAATKSALKVKPNDLINVPGRVHQYLSAMDTITRPGSYPVDLIPTRSHVELDIMYDLVGKFISDVKNDFIYTVIEYQEQGKAVDKTRRTMTAHQVLSSNTSFRYRLRITRKKPAQRTGPEVSRFIANVNFKNNIVNEWYIHSIKEKFEFAVYNSLGNSKCGFFGRLTQPPREQTRWQINYCKNIYAVLGRTEEAINHRHYFGANNPLDRDNLIIYNTIQSTPEHPIFAFNNKPIVIVYWALDMAYRKKNREVFDIDNLHQDRTASYYGNVLFNFMYDWDYSDSTVINAKIKELQKLKYRSNLRYFEILLDQLTELTAERGVVYFNQIKGLMACMDGSSSDSYHTSRFFDLEAGIFDYTKYSKARSITSTLQKDYLQFVDTSNYSRKHSRDTYESYTYVVGDLTLKESNAITFISRKNSILSPYLTGFNVVKDSCYSHFANCKAYTYLDEFELSLHAHHYCLAGFRAIAPLKIKLLPNKYLLRNPDVVNQPYVSYTSALAYADYYHEGFEGMFRVVADEPITVKYPDVLFAGCRINNATDLFNISSAERLIATFMDFQLGSRTGTKTSKGRDAFTSIKRPNSRNEVEINISSKITSALMTFAFSDTVSQNSPLKLKIKSDNNGEVMELFVINGMFFKTNFPNETILMERLNKVECCFLAFYKARTGTGFMKGMIDPDNLEDNAFYAAFRYGLANIRDEPPVDILRRVTYAMTNTARLSEQELNEATKLSYFLISLPRDIQLSNFIAFDLEWIKFSKFSDFDKKILNSYIFGTE